jgi:6,7-dimethyl-8-ribityllumazine synthase
MSAITTIEGTLRADGLRFGLVAGRFNDFVVERLVSGAVDCLLRHGAVHKNLTLIRVPGAFELPLVAKKIAARPDIDGVVCLGAVIRGATPHFDFVAAEVSKGLAQVALDSMTPVGFGILTTDSLEQAIERAGSKAGNKGVEAALAVLEAIRVLEQL